MMEALNGHLLLLDLHRVPSAFTYLRGASSRHLLLSQHPGARRCSASASRRGVPPPSSAASPPSLLRRPAERSSLGRGVGFFGDGDRALSAGTTSTSRAWPAAADGELELFLELLPPRMRAELRRHGEVRELVEVVMDLGRKPIARFPSGDWVISDQAIGVEDLRHAISKVGDFSEDNRSGINNSLHRISAIRNRKLQVIGLTCRVGRAVSGSTEMIRDLVAGGGSILIIGPPGVGKTTLIREIARMLADEHMKRVVIVDTSNEIGGDGDVPHPGIGRARRMQVPNVNLQHNIMIEAVENHMPEVIIIDEIGTDLEAMAASTIAQRGVRLVGTAHGVTIESIMKNPSLQILVGGIESVTLGDDEARRRKVQKTVLERKGPPTFTCAVEMISKTECRVHHKLEETVDAILAGKSPLFEVRKMDARPADSGSLIQIPERHILDNSLINFSENKDSETETTVGDLEDTTMQIKKGNAIKTELTSSKRSPIRVYVYKVLEADLLQVAKVMGLENEIDVTDDIGNANAILALNSEMKQNPWIRSVAKFHKLPVFVIKSNTMAQMVKAARMILGMDAFGPVRMETENSQAKDIEIEDDAPERRPSLEELDALEEVRMAIEYIVIPGGEPVELLPRCSEIIARQLELVESYQLAAEKSGTELNSRLQILPLKLNKKSSPVKQGQSNSNTQMDISSFLGGNAGDTVDRLPLLPE
ncbi:hypothetical protein Taro_013216 [Colocasia esculenta]|uniref:AAA+ ATPase domain-containing protein n=1 Tax=Colocasia esculenta TaxID=4460 RepID=A0A843UFL5_COLES|nr:hypothetical protein [Colocasia esculenta]